ncbi:MAG: hypothetical protein ACRDNO_00565 [Trebonia sp.]
MTVGAGRSAAVVDQGPAEPRPPGKKWRLALLALVGVFVTLACYDLITMSGHYGSNDAAAASHTSSTGAGHGSLSPSASAPAVSASVAPGKTAQVKVAAPVAHPLGVTSAAAFGPDGLSDGDNPGLASRIVDVSSDLAWYSEWYATPEFGDLKPGTGILLDMGETVTVSSVQLVLGTAPGADVQVRVGDSQYPSGLASAASAFDVGGTLRMTVTGHARGRYVLIWFTRLPPDSQGHYQVSLYSATVDGTGGA